jgi:hypothetical protein
MERGPPDYEQKVTTADALEALLPWNLPSSYAQTSAAMKGVRRRIKIEDRT